MDDLIIIYLFFMHSESDDEFRRQADEKLIFFSILRIFSILYIKLVESSFVKGSINELVGKEFKTSFIIVNIMGWHVFVNNIFFKQKSKSVRHIFDEVLHILAREQAVSVQSALYKIM